MGKWGVCRLCHKQGTLLTEALGTFDPTAASRLGHQLFLADLFTNRGQRPPARPPSSQAAERPDARAPLNQLVLFHAQRDLAAHGRTGLHERADPVLAAELDEHARATATALGWSKNQLTDTCFGIRIVLGIRDDDGPVKASNVELLRDIDLPVWTVLKVLAAAGLLEEDRLAALDSWVAQQLRNLPEPMTIELHTWFQVMKNGSPTPPRRRRRSDTTINLHLRWALPILREWATMGHTSLREISKEDVLLALPPSGNPRSTAGQGLKSIFRVLKERRVLFTDPTRRIKTGEHQSREPLPVDIDLLRTALNSDVPAQAAVTALIAFHGLHVRQLQRLHLTHIHDGRLHIDGRTVVLAKPVRERLARYLDERARRWPNTTNPHLFITRHTASRPDPASKRWIWLTLGPGLSAAAVREDRILDEAHATSGDVRRIADLFGLSIQAGTRYTTTVDHPDLTKADD
ncbi:hypothetical protein ACWEKJ_30530 [Amycolatopsis thermoflava]|uniref:hypothetical protein n=1 Tax=Amycolatopsis sp. NPDC006125 TaxID=3156730 RepID=UPI0033B056F0